MAVLDAFVAPLEFFRNSALNLTWSGSVSVWLTSLFGPHSTPTVSIFVLFVISGGHGWAIASAKNTGDQE